MLDEADVISSRWFLYFLTCSGSFNISRTLESRRGFRDLWRYDKLIKKNNINVWTISRSLVWKVIRQVVSSETSRAGVGAVNRIAQWLCHQEAGLVGRSVWAQSSVSPELTHSLPVSECEVVSHSLSVSISVSLPLSLGSEGSGFSHQKYTDLRDLGIRSPKGRVLDYFQKRAVPEAAEVSFIAQL